MRAKYFCSSFNSEPIDDQINEWLEKHPFIRVVDIKFSSTVDDVEALVMFYCMRTYVNDDDQIISLDHTIKQLYEEALQ